MTREQVEQQVFEMRDAISRLPYDADRYIAEQQANEAEKKLWKLFNDEVEQKAAKWDSLAEKMAGFYKEGSKADLFDIGEAAAEAFGYF
jgi:hypothetical protein